MKRLFLSATFLSAALLTAHANVSLPPILSNHMVLQRDVPVPVWGWADPAEDVTVSIANQTQTTKANADGKWRVTLDKLAPGEALTLTVQGKNKLTVTDVLVGEVWLCSGQSNMGFRVAQADKLEEEKAAANHPNLRVFTESSSASPEPQEHASAKSAWAVCTPETVGLFSATAYFFGRDLHAKLEIPVGLINSSVGGTPIEAWTSLEAQKDVPELKVNFDEWDKRIAAWDPAKQQEQAEKLKAAWQAAADKAKAAGKPVPRMRPTPGDPRFDAHRPTTLFNGKIVPLIPYAIRGAVWYQGESNADTVQRGHAYATQLPLLIADWRKHWGYDFPFAWVQLPEYRAHSSDGWALVQEAMLKSLKVPHTGMAVALGLGTVENIHPPHKQAVGHRLALWALADVYGGKEPSSGPLFASQQVEGDHILLSFTHADGGLAAKGGDLKGFVIAGEDKAWKPAAVTIQGDKISVCSPEVAKPVAVRYAWGGAPEFNLYNAADLPASPFRTDDWEMGPATK